jgi:serine/threonine-protein kinase
VSQRLPHDYIVEVMDFQPTPDRTYALVMEFLYGEELRNTLKREKELPPARLVRMVSQMAIGLDQAHAIQYVHRDLKPDNIFLCQTHDGDIVKLLDFGSVKDKSAGANKLTVLGTTIGSPYYMSPEQAQGLDTLDHRADVWAVTAILYECVTGQVPFTGNNGPAILLGILAKEPEPPTHGAPARKYPVPPMLDVVVAEGLRKNPAVRIPTLGALADACGQAYGLPGNHFTWATTSQEELERQIAARLPAVMAAPPAPVARDATDDFFGDAGALHAPRSVAVPARVPMAGVPSPVHGAPYPAPPQGNLPYRPEEEVPYEIPTHGVGWLMPVLVGGVALVMGVLLVLVFL